jgi:hypothetical protein
MRNDVLNTTELAFREHDPEWSQHLKCGTAQLSREQASKLGISRHSISRVNMSRNEVGDLLSALFEIEQKVGNDAVFSRLPIRVATAAWTALVEEMRLRALSN